MTVLELPRAFVDTDVNGALMSWWDPDAECTVAIARPDDNDALWQEYLYRAERSYRRHGIEAAIDIDAIRDSGDTALFWTLLDSAGTVVGGIRAIGPLTSPGQTHAVVEWAEPPRPAVGPQDDLGPPSVRRGRDEVGVGDRGRRTQPRTHRVAGPTGCQVLAVAGVQFCMTTGAQHVLARWRSSGGVVAPIRSTPYSDERFRTKLMWWDRQTSPTTPQPVKPPRSTPRLRPSVTV